MNYDPATRTATSNPDADLVTGATYTATASGAADPAGNVMNPVSWSFTTSGPRICPCTIWDASAVPAVPAAADGAAVELGVKFKADSDGWVYGVRFYKGAGNTGTHVGSLWSAAGAKLASVTFTGESATGWQQAAIWPPVAVTAGTTYVASYRAPAGHYAVTTGYFASSGAGIAPVRALSNAEAAGNGVYKYGAGGFPTQTSASSNYWVDVVFDTAAPTDTVPPVVAGENPAPGATGVPANTPITATFSEPVQAGTISMAVTDAANNPVAGSVAYDAPTRTARFTPSAALVSGATYSVTVSGAKDLFDNPMAAPETWGFTISAASCPCTVFGTTAPAELGQRQPGRRGGDEVPGRPTRFHQRGPLLQGRRQHRNASGQPVERRRHPAGRGGVRRRIGDRLADGEFRRAGRGQPEHHLRGLLPHEHRPLRRDEQLFRRPAGGPAAAGRPGRRRGRAERRVQVRRDGVSDELLPEDELLGRPRLRVDRQPGHRGADGRRPDSGERGDHQPGVGAGHGRPSTNRSIRRR